MRIAAAFALALASSLFAPCAAGETTGSTGGGQSIDNRQPTLAIGYYICVQGLYPDPDQGIPRSQNFPTIGEIRLFAGNFTPTGWASCNGTLLSIAQNNALFSLLGSTYGGNGTSNFALPNLLGRVPIGVSAALPRGATAGSASPTLLINQLPSHTHSLPDGAVSPMGGGQPVDNRQPVLALRHLIITGGADAGEILLDAGWRIGGGNTLPCEGQLLAIASYPELHARIGTRYGGDGVTTFALPDARGRILVGAGLSSFGSLTEGGAFGSESFTISEAQMPAHNHTLPAGTTGTTGGAASIDNRQPSLVVNFMLRAQGTVPTSGGNVANDPFLGEVRLFGASPAQLGTTWLALSGEHLFVQDHQSLYSLLGNAYGGVPAGVMFAVPNAAGRGVAGPASGGSRGDIYGNADIALTTAQIPAHSHWFPPPPTAATGSANTETVPVITLSGTVSAHDGIASVHFDYGTSTAYGSTVAATPGTVSGSALVSVSASLAAADLNPGTTYHFRIRATSSGGTTAGTDATFTSPTRLQLWRFAAYGFADNHGAAADSATPRGDGVPNLMKFATGLPPDRAATQPGHIARNGSNLEFTYPRSTTAAPEVTYIVEWSDTLESASWSSAGVNESVMETVNGVQSVKATVPLDADGRRFVRLRVTSP